MEEKRKKIRTLIIIWYSIIFLSFFWNYIFIFDLFSHFYLQYFFIWIIILIFGIFLKDKISIIACILLLIFLWININKSEIIHKEISFPIDYYYLNANYYINKPKEIVNNIKKYNPKYVIIVELNKELKELIIKELKFKNNIYYDNWFSSFWFFTNEIIENQKIHNLTYPVWEFKTINWTIFVIHPFPPLNQEFSILQKKNFMEIKNLFENTIDENKMIIWDYNSSYYSMKFKKYFWEYYHKPIYSWWNIILKIPIDYAIWNKDYFYVYSNNLRISDHSPLLIKLKNLN